MNNQLRKALITITLFFTLSSPLRAESAIVARDHKDPLSDRVLIVDLPFHKHRKNVGGSDGAGLCVFASMTHAAYWQRILELEIAFDDMKKHPGGGWPEKVDRVINRLFPGYKNYIQAEGDEYAIPLIDWAMSTGRMVCTTYGYSERYGGRVAHMVNLVYCDNQRACILDNNFPNTYEWMSRNEYLRRARMGGGIWVYAFLEPPAPPIPILERKEDKMLKTMLCSILLSPLQGCSQFERPYPAIIEVTVSDPRTTIFIDGVKTSSQGLKRSFQTPPLATSQNYSYTLTTDSGDSKIVTVSGGKKFALDWQHNPDNLLITQNFGVDQSKISKQKRLTLGGTAVDPKAVFGPMIPPSDAHKPFISVVGDNSYNNQVKNVLDNSPLKDKFVISYYNPTDFHVKEVGYAEGITITAPRDKTGKAKAYHYQAVGQPVNNVNKAIERVADPKFDPTKIPDLSKERPKNPDPVPINQQTLLIIGGILLALYILSQRKGQQ